MSNISKFLKEQKHNCIKASKYLQDMLGLEVRCHPTILYELYGIEVNKLIRVEIVLDETDCKYLDIDYDTILEKMTNDSYSFEKAVYDSLVYSLVFEPNSLSEYKANVYEKLLNNYINNPNTNFSQAGYFIHPDQKLCCSGELKSEDYHEIVYMEDITSIIFLDDSVTISIKDGTDDEENVSGYKLEFEGYRKIYNDGNIGDLNIIEAIKKPEPEPTNPILNILFKKEQYEKEGFPHGNTDEGFEKWQEEKMKEVSSKMLQNIMNNIKPSYSI